jgi:hypothetical protein
MKQDMNSMQMNLSEKAKNSMQPSMNDSTLRAIAYSMDTLIPGFYLWCGKFKIRIGGSLPEPTYPGVIHSLIGVTLILPGYRIYTTYQDTYDPR